MNRRRVRKADEAFTRLSWRITQSLRLGEITFDEHGVLVYLVAVIERYDHPLVTTLRALKDDLWWVKSLESLRLLLKRLERERWITADVTPGGSRWTIRLSRARVLEQTDQAVAAKEPPSKPQELSSPELEVASRRRTSDTGVSPGTEREYGARGAPRLDPASEEEEEGEEEEALTDSSAAHNFGVFLDPDARHAFEETMRLLDRLDARFDGKTQATFLRHFSELTSDDWQYLAEETEKRCDDLESPIRYAYGIGENIRAGYSGQTGRSG